MGEEVDFSNLSDEDRISASPSPERRDSGNISASPSPERRDSHLSPEPVQTQAVSCSPERAQSSRSPELVQAKADPGGTLLQERRPAGRATSGTAAGPRMARGSVAGLLGMGVGEHSAVLQAKTSQPSQPSQPAAPPRKACPGLRKRPRPPPGPSEVFSVDSPPPQELAVANATVAGSTPASRGPFHGAALVLEKVSEGQASIACDAKDADCSTSQQDDSATTKNSDAENALRTSLVDDMNAVAGGALCSTSQGTEVAADAPKAVPEHEVDLSESSDEEPLPPSVSNSSAAEPKASPPPSPASPRDLAEVAVSASTADKANLPSPSSPLEPGEVGDPSSHAAEATLPVHSSLPDPAEVAVSVNADEGNATAATCSDKMSPAAAEVLEEHACENQHAGQHPEGQQAKGLDGMVSSSPPTPPRDPESNPSLSRVAEEEGGDDDDCMILEVTLPPAPLRVPTAEEVEEAARQEEMRRVVTLEASFKDEDERRNARAARFGIPEGAPAAGMAKRAKTSSDMSLSSYIMKGSLQANASESDEDPSPLPEVMLFKDALPLKRKSAYRSPPPTPAKFPKAAPRREMPRPKAKKMPRPGQADYAAGLAGASSQEESAPPLKLSVPQVHPAPPAVKPIPPVQPALPQVHTRPPPVLPATMAWSTTIKPLARDQTMRPVAQLAPEGWRATITPGQAAAKFVARMDGQGEPKPRLQTQLCREWMRSRQCKYGLKCKFLHSGGPEPCVPMVQQSQPAESFPIPPWRQRHIPNSEEESADRIEADPDIENADSGTPGAYVDVALLDEEEEAEANPVTEGAFDPVPEGTTEGASDSGLVQAAFEGEALTAATEEELNEDGEDWDLAAENLNDEPAVPEVLESMPMDMGSEDDEMPDEEVQAMLMKDVGLADDAALDTSLNDFSGEDAHFLDTIYEG